MKKLFFLLPLILFTGCDLFETREAQEPNQSRSNFQPAVEPQIVIQNLVNAFNDKNSENYLASFVDSTRSDKKFYFIPSSSAAARYPILLNNWSLKDEEYYFNNIKVKAGDNIISLSFNDTLVSLQGDSLLYSASYNLNVPFSDASLPSNYEGKLRFNMIRDDNLIWRIYYWEDLKSSDSPSWSELKGRFSN